MLSGGDFFVWCDFLLGVLSVEVLPTREEFLLVTDESKPDWKTGEGGHPYLLEEFRWVRGGRLSIVSLADVRRMFKSDEAAARAEEVAADDTSNQGDADIESTSTTADPGEPALGG